MCVTVATDYILTDSLIVLAASKFCSLTTTQFYYYSGILFSVAVVAVGGETDGLIVLATSVLCA